MSGENGSEGMKLIRINNLFQFFNFIIFCLIITGFFRSELVNHKFVNELTLILGLLLCIQTHIVLHLELRNNDPFIIIMAYVLIFFFSLRIFTLLIFPVQPVFYKVSSNPYNADHSNFALIYILIANCFIYLGFYFVKVKGVFKIKTINYLPSKPRSSIIFFLISLFFGIFLQDFFPSSIKTLLDLLFHNFYTPQKILIVL